MEYPSLFFLRETNKFHKQTQTVYIYIYIYICKGLAGAKQTPQQYAATQAEPILLYPVYPTFTITKMEHFQLTI
jgi:hypothetical protein